MQKLIITIMFCLTCISLTACSGKASVGYQPPVIPIKISINTNGEVEVSWENSIQTPFGTFSAEVSSNLSEMYIDRNGVLIVNVNDVNTVYDLNGKNNVAITLESGYYKQIALRKEGLNWYFKAIRISNESSTSQADLNIVATTSSYNATLTAIPTLQPNLMDYKDYIQISDLNNTTDRGFEYLTFSLTNLSNEFIILGGTEKSPCNRGNFSVGPGETVRDWFCQGRDGHNFWLQANTDSITHFCWLFQPIDGTVKNCP